MVTTSMQACAWQEYHACGASGAQLHRFFTQLMKCSMCLDTCCAGARQTTTAAGPLSGCCSADNKFTWWCWCRAVPSQGPPLGGRQPELDTRPILQTHAALAADRCHTPGSDTSAFAYTQDTPGQVTSPGASAAPGRRREGHRARARSPPTPAAGRAPRGSARARALAAGRLKVAVVQLAGVRLEHAAAKQLVVQRAVVHHPPPPLARQQHGLLRLWFRRARAAGPSPARARARHGGRAAAYVRAGRCGGGGRRGAARRQRRVVAGQRGPARADPSAGERGWWCARRRHGAAPTPQRSSARQTSTGPGHAPLSVTVPSF